VAIVLLSKEVKDLLQFPFRLVAEVLPEQEVDLSRSELLDPGPASSQS
jgi:hypothetical protein